MNVSQCILPSAAQSSITAQQQQYKHRHHHHRTHHHLPMSSNQNYYEDYGHADFNNPSRLLLMAGQSATMPINNMANMKPTDLRSPTTDVLTHQYYTDSSVRDNNCTAGNSMYNNHTMQPLPHPPQQISSCFSTASSNYYCGITNVPSAMLGSPLSEHVNSIEDECGRMSQMSSQQHVNWYHPPEPRVEYNNLINMLQVKQR